MTSRYKYHTLLTLKVPKVSDYRLILFDNDAPQPSDIYKLGSGDILTWRIEGAFNTTVNKEYFNDIKDKLLFLLNANFAHALHLTKNITDKIAFPQLENRYSKHQKIVSLSDFNNLDDLRPRRTRVRFAAYAETNIFKKVRIYAYSLQEQGLLSIDRIDEAIQRYAEKEYNIYKHLARLIYDWIVDKVDSGKWYVGSKQKIYEISRSENALIQTKQRSSNKYSRFKNYVDFMGYENLVISNIAKKINISRPTIYKYMRLYLLNKSVKFIGLIGGKCKAAVTCAARESKQVTAKSYIFFKNHIDLIKKETTTVQKEKIYINTC